MGFVRSPISTRISSFRCWNSL